MKNRAPRTGVAMRPLIHPLSLAIFCLLATPAVFAQEADKSSSKEAEKLDTVVVTGSRRQQELKDFAGSITPLSGKQLTAMGANKMQDYLTRVPGVSFVEGRPGQSNITIRGIGTTLFQDQGQASTGVFINDVPLTEPVYSFSTPDVDTFDVERVEILRGPQGTQYGAGTLGGAVNYIATMPQQGVTEGRLLLGVSNTDHATGYNAEIKHMINVPLTERIALRTVFAARKEQGFITNIGLKRGSNDSTVAGGRIMLGWDITDTASLNWMTLFQKIDNRDTFYDRSDLGDYNKQGTRDPFSTSVMIHNLKYTQHFQPATLTVSLTRKQKDQSAFFDLSVNPFMMNVILGGATGPAGITQTASIPGTTFEARLTSQTPPNARFEWSAGLFYDRTKEDILVKGYAQGAAASINAAWAGKNFPPGSSNPPYPANIGAIGAPNDQFYFIGDHPIGSERAVFGEMSFRFADAWKLTLGGRYYQTEVQIYGERAGFLGMFGTTAPASSSLKVSQKENGFSPKFVLSYSFNDNNMLYGLASRGFRYGGPNPNPPGAVDAGPTFDSDRINNYELGFRTSSANGTWLADITAFRIDWSNVQVRRFTPVTDLAYAANLGKARIVGVEAAGTWQPNKQFSTMASFTYTDAKTQEPFVLQTGTPPVVAPTGTTLPGASKYRASLMTTYQWDNAYAPFVSANYAYLSSAPSMLDNQDKYRMGGYGVFNLRAGFNVMRNMTLSGYVNNAANTYGVTSSSNGFATPNSVVRTMIRPRTIGVSLDMKF